MVARILLLFGLSTAIPFGVAAQDLDFHERGIRRDTIDVHTPQPWQLLPFILPGSETLALDGVPLDTTAYALDARYGRLRLERAVADTAAVLVVAYRVFPFSFRDVYANRRYQEAGPDSTLLTRLVEEQAEPGRDFDPLGDTQLQRRGSITRGIIAGSNRDVALESGLRLELAGEVTEGVSVQAVLTDENTPIQPDGTTQRLSEFDRVFIQIEAARGRARLGDYDLRFQGTEFAPFNRKLQGISLQGRVPDVPGRAVGGGTVTVAGATSRGIYHALTLQALDGVQGPYRLEGRQGERFIIVIAGSERVYLDGDLLTRGETNDYIIDYATGEVTFTSRRLIAEDSRINVEFEYTTNRFTRTLLGSQADAAFLQRGEGPARLRIKTTVLREADSRAFTQELGLDSRDQELLEMIGDSTAGVPGGDPVPFDPEAPYVQYVQRDTLGQTIFVPLTDTAAVDTVYRVRFTRVPPGSGDYRRVGRSVNGILFEWVGAGRGDYRAERLLPRPRLQNLVDFEGVFEPVEGVQIFGEWARSVVDENRLSPFDDADNGGSALLAGLRVLPTEVEVRGTRLGSISGELRRRSTASEFEAFDRTRPVEFGRRWNLARPVSATGGVAEAGRERVLEGSARFDVTPTSGISAEWGDLSLGDDFDGSRVAVEARADQPGLPRLEYRAESLSSVDSVRGEDGSWWRQRGGIRQPVLGSRVTPFLEVEHESRRLRELEGGLLARPSFSFVEWRPGVAVESELVRFTGSLERRTERGWAEGGLRDRAKSWTGQAGLALRGGSRFSTEADVGYRVRRFAAYFREQDRERDNESVAVRWKGRFNPLRRALTANWIYDALTEKTPLLQETYVLTGPEIGEFVWEDGNEDGIRQFDEFIPERLPNEGLYSRTFVPSDSLEPVINVQARLSLTFEPGRLLEADAGGLQAVLSQLSGQTSVEVREKSREPVLRRIYLLNLTYFDRTETTVNGLMMFRQRVEAFRGRPYGGSLVYLRRTSTAQRAASTERLGGSNWQVEARARATSRLGVRIRARTETKRSESFDPETGQASRSRTFNIRSTQLNPEAAWQFRPGVQATVGVEWGGKTDSRPGTSTRRASLVKVPVEGRVSLANRLQVFSRFEWARVRLDGEAVGLAAYELTDGRGPGRSYTWSMTTQYQFNSLIHGSLSYDGRAPSEAPVLHTVRMQFGMRF